MPRPALVLDRLDICINHDARQFAAVNCSLPSELLLGLGGISNERIYFGWSQVALIELHMILPVHPQMTKRLIQEIADREADTCSEYVVIRGWCRNW